MNTAITVDHRGTIEIKAPTITEGLIEVGIALTTPAGTSTGMITIHGTPGAGHQYGYGGTERVYVTSIVEQQVLNSYTLDPNEPENDYDVVLAEVSQIAGTTIEAVTDSIDGLTAIAVAYVTSGRPVWK